MKLRPRSSLHILKDVYTKQFIGDRRPVIGHQSLVAEGTRSNCISSMSFLSEDGNTVELGRKYNQVDWKHILNILRVRGEKSRKVNGGRGACWWVLHVSELVWHDIAGARELGVLKASLEVPAQLLLHPWLRAGPLLFVDSQPLWPSALKEGCTWNGEGERWHLPSQPDQPAGDRHCGQYSLTSRFYIWMFQKTKKGELTEERWALALLLLGEGLSTSL